MGRQASVYTFGSASPATPRRRSFCSAATWPA